MIDFTLYTANCCGDSSNCVYPNKAHITDSASFVAAIKQDHVCAAYKNNYRSNDNFLETDALPMDCDNDHSDDPKDWIYPLDVVMAFPDVSLLVSYSRNNMKVKNGKAARPKFHVYFPIPTMTDGKAYAELKKRIQEFFPYFDADALGEARFLYGTDSPDIEVYDGAGNVADFIDRDEFADFDASTEEISEGSRNSTMSHIAGKLIKRYGATDEAHALFMKTAEKCNPPLADSELDATYTNKGSEPLYAYCSFAVRAFQNDVQIDEVSDINGDEASLIKEIKNGETIDVTYVFKMTDESKVEVLVGEPTADQTTIGTKEYFGDKQ